MVPLVVGLATGERPAALALVGALIALGAVALVAGGAEEGSTGPASGRYPVLLALGAGAAFGLVFVILSATDEASGFWPLVGELRQSIFQAVAASDSAGMIFTYVWSLDDTSDKAFIDSMTASEKAMRR